MNSTSLQWWMDALRQNVYTQVIVIVISVLIFGISIMNVAMDMPYPVIANGVPYHKFLVLFGMAGVFCGIASCVGSGLLYDVLNKKLHSTLVAEKKGISKKHKSKKEDVNA